MKKIILFTLMLMLLISSFNLAYAGIDVNEENKYGLKLGFGLVQNDNIKIEGIYVYQDDKDYIFTLLYSGEVGKINIGGEERLYTSFFSPPNGDEFMVSFLENYSDLTFQEGIIQYKVDSEKIKSSRSITIFIADSTDEVLMTSSEFSPIDYDIIPQVEQLIKGYNISSDIIHEELNTTPSPWATKNILELKAENILAESSFDYYQDGITRERFVYLMVILYERLTNEIIKVDNSLQFKDTSNIDTLKAASIGITSGIGNNQFGPDIILNREQMATLVIKTLTLANIELAKEESVVPFEDDKEISSWAKDAIYKAKYNSIISGIGSNLYSPNSQATNEQALYLTHNLLQRYGNLKWYEERDKDRFYLKFNDSLYKVEFGNNIIIDPSMKNNNIYFQSLDDFEIYLNLALLKEWDLDFENSQNPNFKGTITLPDYEYMSVTVDNIYYGVDKIGEKTNILIELNKQDKIPVATVTDNTKTDTIKHDGFKNIKYYDLKGDRRTTFTLPTHLILKEIGVEYSISYHRLWDIYIIEFFKN